MDCAHDRVQWIQSSGTPRGVCVDCGDELVDLGDELVNSSECEAKVGPAGEGSPLARRVRANALREDRFLADPFSATREHRLEESSS